MECGDHGSKANRKGLEVGGSHRDVPECRPACTRSASTTSSAARIILAAATVSSSRGHASPGIYARAYLEGRLTTDQLDAFRQEVSHGPGNGLSSYPHPRLMPHLGVPNRFYGYRRHQLDLPGAVQPLHAQPRHQDHRNSAFGASSATARWESRSRSGLSDSPRGKNSTTTWVINCNLQQLDGPVRGNGKIVQARSIFLGAGWHVIKVLWGHDWDPCWQPTPTVFW